MKEKIKKLTPEWILNIRRKRMNKRDYKVEYRRFKNSAYGLVKNKNKENLKAIISLQAHRVEKGLTNSNFKEGIGMEACNSLIEGLKEYKEKGYDLNDIIYQTGISSLSAYISRHIDTNVDTTFLETSVRELSSGKIKNYGGVFDLLASEAINSSQSNFKEFAMNRWSVRDYSNKDVSLDDINEALEIASKTPSICNKQPWNTYVIKDQQLIQTTLKTIGSSNILDNIKVLLLITSNNNYLAGVAERNQGYIGAGMYGMNLLYSLHYKKLATCVLNARFNFNTDKNIRELLQIPNSQEMIFYIAVGHYLDETKVPISKRDHYKEKTKYF